MTKYAPLLWAILYLASLLLGIVFAGLIMPVQASVAPLARYLFSLMLVLTVIVLSLTTWRLTQAITAPRVAWRWHVLAVAVAVAAGVAVGAWAVAAHSPGDSVLAGLGTTLLSALGFAIATAVAMQSLVKILASSADLGSRVQQTAAESLSAADAGVNGMKAGTRERVGAFWNDLFGGGLVGGEGSPVVVHHGERLSGYPGIYCIRRQGVVLVSRREPLVGTVSSWNPSAKTFLDLQWWASRLPGWGVLGPSTHSFLDQTDLLEDAVGDAVVRNAEWAESGLAGSDVAQAWVATDGQDQPFAATGLTWFDGIPVDVGVITAPSARGLGVATAAAATAARHAVEHHGIARWRALEVNAGSRRIAGRLGFEDDCLQLAVRPEQ